MELAAVGASPRPAPCPRSPSSKGTQTDDTSAKRRPSTTTSPGHVMPEKPSRSPSGLANAQVRFHQEDRFGGPVRKASTLGFRRHAGTALMALLSACGGRDTGICIPSILGPSSDPDCHPPSPPPCDAIVSQTWSVTRQQLEISVGESRLLGLSTFGGYRPLTVCADRVRTVTWTVADPSVVSLIPEAQPLPDRVWVTGMFPGRTLVTARIRFVDGNEKVAGPADVRIVPAGGPPGARLIASAQLTF